jgi:hypothetical protein
MEATQKRPARDRGDGGLFRLKNSPMWYTKIHGKRESAGTKIKEEAKKFSRLAWAGHRWEFESPIFNSSTKIFEKVFSSNIATANRGVTRYARRRTEPKTSSA